MVSRGLVVLCVLSVGCGGDDSSARHPDDAPQGVAVTLSVDPDASIASGETLQVTATIARSGFDGDVVIAPTSASSDLTVTGGTIAAGATSVPLQLVANAAANSSHVDVSVEATAEGITIAPASIAVSIRGQFGMPIGGAAANDNLGESVALSADGKRIVIGAPLATTNGAEAGYARVYERSGTDWVQVGADLLGEAAADRYGGAVAISNDGSRIAIGSYENDGGSNNGGSTKVFDLVGGTWTQVGADIDGLRASGQQGWSLSLSGSGSRIVIGAPTSASIAGTALVYELVNNAWTQVGTTFMGNRELGDAVAMSDDGNRVAIGSTSANGSEMYTGKVDVFSWNGAAWTQMGAPILGSEPAALAGTSVSLSADGNTVALGASQADGNGPESGEVRVYHFDGTAWTQVGNAMLGAAGASRLGDSVSISADGTRLVACEPGNGGIVPYFRLISGTWTLAPGPTFAMGARNGTGIAISPDGHTAAVGLPSANSSHGEVRVYDLP
ncbi:MAG TPA: hypothetical protein VGM39_16410 [Kofleriaceae bacterium]|jgi:hypothetical protein